MCMVYRVQNLRWMDPLCIVCKSTGNYCWTKIFIFCWCNKWCGISSSKIFTSLSKKLLFIRCRKNILLLLFF